MPPKTPPAIHWTHPITGSQVRNLIRAEPNIHKALLIFDSATAEYPSGYRHDLPTFTLISSRLAVSGDPRRALILLLRARRELSLPIPEPALLPLLRSLSPRRPLLALGLILQSPSLLGVTPTHRSYSLLLSLLVAGNHLGLARNFFKHMRGIKVPLTVTTYNAVIKALCLSGSHSVAVQVLRRMPKPDACSYNTLIDGFCKLGEIDKARNFFQEMQENQCLPTVVTYSSLIHGLCCSGDVDGALELFDEMRGRGVRPNVITYSALVDGLCKGGRAVKALEVVERMEKEKCRANMITFSGLIDGLCREGRLQEAMEVLDRMRVQGKKPDAGLYGKIVKGLCDLKRFHEAANYLDEMVLSGVLPNRVTWSLHVRMHNLVVRGLCGESDGSRAFQMYQSMRTRGLCVDPESFQLLAEFLCKSGDVQRASQVAYEMLVDGCLPDKITWSAIVGMFWNRRKTQQLAEWKLIELMDECAKSEPVLHRM